jgi:hypothetical protein
VSAFLIRLAGIRAAGSEWSRWVSSRSRSGFTRRRTARLNASTCWWTREPRTPCFPARSWKPWGTGRCGSTGHSGRWTHRGVEVVECAGRRTYTPILMGPASGPALLGATTLVELGFGVDPLGRRLVPVCRSVPGRDLTFSGIADEAYVRLHGPSLTRSRGQPWGRSA